MFSSLTFATLQTELSRLGFQVFSVRDTHLMYEHTPSNTTIIIHRYQPDQVLSPLDLTAVRRPLIERGLLDEEAFERLLSKKSA